MFQIEAGYLSPGKDTVDVVRAQLQSSQAASRTIRNGCTQQFVREHVSVRHVRYPHRLAGFLSLIPVSSSLFYQCQSPEPFLSCLFLALLPEDRTLLVQHVVPHPRHIHRPPPDLRQLQQMPLPMEEHHGTVRKLVGHE